MKTEVNIFWFRRDLRLDDNAGLYHALKSGIPVVPVFIFDRGILDELEDQRDRRVTFIHQRLLDIQADLLNAGSTLDVRHGFPADVFRGLLEDYQVSQIFCNHDYEPYAVERDRQVAALASDHGIGFNSYKDQVIFEKSEVVKDDGAPYTVFTPYWRKWKARLNRGDLQPFPTEKFLTHFHKQAEKPVPALASMGFRETPGHFPSREPRRDIIRQYHQTRDLPAIEGTSRLSVHLRFGSIGIRNLVRLAGDLNETFLKELVWREFYQMILWHFPRVLGESFRREYDSIPWRNDESEFERWTAGLTGYPVVDAGIRELNETGFMHNRARMITASFLTRHLLIDWRWGEAYFAKKLLDYDLASNNGGWQWAAGSGSDAAPYFRIFNPSLQVKRFDPRLEYLRKWVPEFEEPTYPPPMVDHEFARTRCLEVYRKALRRV